MEMKGLDGTLDRGKTGRVHGRNSVREISCRQNPPVTVGAGLIALDWLMVGKERKRPNQAYAGGSCGNVMSILAFLGWKSYPIGRLGRDHRAQQVIRDFERWEVNTEFVLKRQTGATPVIIVRLKEKPDGSIVRRYEWRHPQSKDWLPRYRPLPKRDAKELMPKLPSANVFYFDRAEKSVLLLAEQMRDQGAIVFFEPSSTSNQELFSQCLAVSDIVKYSAEIFPEPLENPASQSPRLEIQTLGEEGLRYRIKVNSTTPGKWRHLPPFVSENGKDTTGCGDWCSAGIIAKLCDCSRDDFLNLGVPDIEEGIQFGQALAAVNHTFLGARGPMYHLGSSEFLAQVEQIRI